LTLSTIGGKAKPLKAPKKAPKGELDEEDKAFQEKQKAGPFFDSTLGILY
jgi:hypothetical protein